MISRRQWVALAGSCFGAAVVGAADVYPARPIRIVVPYPPGGTSDVLARTIGAKLAQALGSSVVVENKPGAGGVLGTDAVAKAKPDGYTLLVTTTLVVQAPALFPAIPFDVLKDLTAVSEIGHGPLILAARGDLPAATLPAFVSAAKATPGKFTYGTPSVASTAHLYMELLKKVAGIDILHVPYKGGAPLVSAMLAGEVDLGILTADAADPHFQSGRLKPLAITGERRFRGRDTPTYREQGFAGFEPQGFHGFLAPAQTPAAVVSRLSAEIARIVNAPEFSEFLANKFLLEPVGGTPEAFAALMRQDLARWQDIVQKTGVKPE